MSYEKIYRDHLESLRESGEGKARARCPFHSGGAPSLRVDFESGYFRCYSGRCDVQHGNAYKFLTELGYEPDAAKELLKDAGASWTPRAHDISFSQTRRRDPHTEVQLVPEEYLAPFKGAAPKYLVEVGFKLPVLKRFEVAWDHKAGAALFPVRDYNGNLATVVSRDPGTDPEQKGPKYLPHFRQIRDIFPEYNVQPNPKNHIYNAWRAKNYWDANDPEKWFILVEGYKACIWVEQAGFPNVVALQGSYISGTQIQILSKMGGFLLLLLDGDEGGRNGTFYVGNSLLRRKGVNALGVAECPEDLSPDDLTAGELKKLLSNYEPFVNWRVQYGAKKDSPQSSSRFS
jgi:DNA primase